MDRQTFLGTLTGGLLAAPLAAEAREPTAVPSSPELDARLDTLPFLLVVAVMVFLLFTGILAFISSRRRRRTLAKVLVPLGAGSVCGALWILLVDTVVTTAAPKVAHEPAVLVVVGVLMAALVMASLLWISNRLGKVVGLSVLALGFHSLALPIAALISLLIGGERARDPRTVALSVGGLLFGVFFVFVGDRVFRSRSRSRPRARFGLSGPHA